MAQETNFLVNNNDLNTIFAPIVVNQIDYGVLGNNKFVGEKWVNLNPITQTNTQNNIQLTGHGFQITSSGFYRLNVTLNFGQANEEAQPIVFILSSDDSVPINDEYEFIPSPTMSVIYSINCSGASNNDGNANNSLNSANIGNCFALNGTYSGSNFNNIPYFFSFTTRKNSSGSSNSRPNFFTLDITFNANKDQVIYPYIRCRESSTDPNVTLQNSKWMFTKINNIPS